MRINFYATLRQVAGAKTIEISPANGATVRRLVAEIVERYPAMREHLLNEHGELSQHVHVMVNGRDLPFLEEGKETLLSTGDTLDIFPAVGGG